MDPAAARKHLTPERAALALCAGAGRAGTVGRPHTSVVHGLVEASRHGIFPTFAALVQSFSDVPFSPDTRSFPSSNRYINLDFLSVFNIAHTTTVADLLRVLVHGCITSVHALSAALELLESTEFRASTGFQQNSIVDLFLRRTFVAFSSLDFSGLTTLREALAEYVRGTSDPKPPSAASVHPFPLSITRSSIASLTAGTPIARNADFTALCDLHTSAPKTRASAGPALAHASFALQLEAARRRDGRLAADALHRAFDLVLGARKSAAPGVPREEAGRSRFASRRARAPPPPVAGERSQYAALALAALSSSLGDFARAAEALDDAVRNAQHAGDDWCQQRALGWLVHTARAPARRRELLSRAGDPVALAEEELRSPRAFAAPAAAEATELAASAARMRRIARRVGASTGDLRAAPLLVSAAAWMSHACVPTALSVARAALASARAERATNPDTTAPGALLSSAEARALCAVASLTALEETPGLGIAQLDAVLSHRRDSACKEEFAGDSSSAFPELDALRRTRTWLALKHSIARHDLAAAEARLAEIEAFATCPAGAGGCPLAVDERRLDALEAKARLLLARGECGAACSAAHELRKEAASCALPERAIEGARLATLAHLHGGASSAALPLALGAVALSRELGFAAAHVGVTLVLAETVFRVDGGREAACAAEKILVPVLPRALGGMGRAVRGYARRLFAQITMAKSSSPQSAEYAAAILGLEDGLQAYKDADDVAGIRDCSFLLARARDARGEKEKRDNMASVFREHVICMQQREMSFA